MAARVGVQIRAGSVVQRLDLGGNKSVLQVRSLDFAGEAERDNLCSQWGNDKGECSDFYDDTSFLHSDYHLPWGGGTPLPKITPEDIRKASKSFPNGTASTYDGIHVRHFTTSTPLLPWQLCVFSLCPAARPWIPLGLARHGRSDKRKH